MNDTELQNNRLKTNKPSGLTSKECVNKNFSSPDQIFKPHSSNYLQ